MKINKLSKEGNLAIIEVQEDYTKIEEAIDKVYPELAKDAKIKGFRQGKVPRAVFERYYGNELLIERASSEVVNDVYHQIIKEKNIEVIDYPKEVKVNHLKEGEQFVFTIKVEVKPEIKLGKYKGLKVNKGKAEINEEKFNEYINEMRERFAEYVEVSGRPVKEDDIIRYDMKALINGSIYENWTRDDSGTRIGLGWISDEFDSYLKGMKMFEEKDFGIEFPADYKEKDVAGKKVDFHIKIKEIREKKLPELNDEFARKLSQERFNKWNDFENDLKRQMIEEAKITSENKLKEDLIALVVEDSEIEVSETLIKREVDAMVRRLEDALKQSKVDLENYLKMIQKDKNMLEEEYRADAVKKIKGMFILEEISKKEKLDVTDEDIENEIKRMADDAKKGYDEFKNNISDDLRTYIKEYLKDKKTIDFLIDDAKIREL